MDGELKVFGGRAHPSLVQDICDYLQIPPGKMTKYTFSDGEIFCQIDENVRGSDVFVVQPTCHPVNENLIELLIMLDAFKRSSASRVTAVMPYYGYARQDKKDQPRVPITAKLVADLISAAGADRILTMDLHASQIQGFFDVPVDNIYAAPVFALDIRHNFRNLADITVVSPDVGGVARARELAERINADLAIVDKRRISGSQIAVEHVIGDVEGRNVLIVDDMISTGGSISEAARVVRKNGARHIVIAATHGVLCGPAVERLDAAPIDRILITDSIPPRQKTPKKLEIVSVAPLLARAIMNIHRNESVSRLFD